jgi:hypothetical protein
VSRNPEVVRLSAKRTDPACNIQSCSPNQLPRFEVKIPPILFEDAPEQYDPFKVESAFGSHSSGERTLSRVLAIADFEIW